MVPKLGALVNPADGLEHKGTIMLGRRAEGHLNNLKKRKKKPALRKQRGGDTDAKKVPIRREVRRGRVGFAKPSGKDMETYEKDRKKNRSTSKRRRGGSQRDFVEERPNHKGWGGTKRGPPPRGGLAKKRRLERGGERGGRIKGNESRPHWRWKKFGGGIKGKKGSGGRSTER